MDGARVAVETGTPARATRNVSPAWVAGPLSAGLGLAAHLAAGGRAPGVLIAAALAALLAMAAAITGRYRLPAWAVLVAAGLAQQLLHLAFAALSTGSGFTLPGHHDGAPIPEAAGAPAAEASGAGHSLHVMLHLHVAAALVVTAVLTQWTRVVSVARRRATSGGERAPGDADA